MRTDSELISHWINIMNLHPGDLIHFRIVAVNSRSEGEPIETRSEISTIQLPSGERTNINKSEH